MRARITGRMDSLRVDELETRVINETQPIAFSNRTNRLSQGINSGTRVCTGISRVFIIEQLYGDSRRDPGDHVIADLVSIVSGNLYILGFMGSCD